jgi:c-di-GMP-binding flagellar brake protein YcgR
MSEKQLSEDQVTTLPKSLIQVGIPLEFPVYDIRGRLLMSAGTVVTSEEQLERLYERGLYLNKKTINQLRAGKTKGGADSKKDKDKEEEPPQKLVDLPLNSIKLGESIQISPLTDDTNSTKYIVKFLGGLEKHSIICTAPTQDDKLIFIKEHAGFLVRLFSGKEVYNFTTTTSAVLSKPFPHIHLKFPRGVYSRNLRKNQRVQTSIICSLINHGSGEFKDIKSSGRIVDISMGGAMIEANKIAGDVNDEIECTFKLKLNDTEVLFSIPSILRNISEHPEDENNQKYSQGVQFKDIPFQEKTMLQNYIFQLLTGNDLNSL